MAQTSVINGILGNLVNSIASQSKSSNPRSIRQSKEAAFKGVKAHQHVRTNQFEVQATLDGLVEKFSVLNRDDLADALSKRLTELQHVSKSKWTPEILSLFINLSDRPDQKSTLEALELLRPPSPHPSSITWEEIIADDPLTGELWQDESYSSFSEDEVEIEEEIELVEKRGRKAEDEESMVQNIQSILTPVSLDTIVDLKAAQFWNHSKLRESAPQQISELQVIREVLFMLRGLPTSLFAIDTQHTLIYHAMNVMLVQVSLSGLNDVLQSFANIGSDLFRLRVWTAKEQNVPLLQAFNFAVSIRLRTLERDIANIEQHFTAPSSPVVISVLQLHQEISILCRPFGPLGELAASVPAHGGDFICLELLYDQIYSLQAVGDDECYTFLSKIFFECLQVYLRPVTMWMEEGTIIKNDEAFFISVADKGSASSSLWHDRFTLKTASDGHLHAPKFLHPAAKKILNAGKSIVLLQHLKYLIPKQTGMSSSELSFENVCGSQEIASLLPFSELFGSAFTEWIGSKYGLAASILKQQLFEGCGLLQHLDALEHVYFSKDGVRFQAFADELFQRMDGRKAAWNDKFILSELARSVFGSIDTVQGELLSVRMVATKQPTRSMKALSGLLIDLNLPWPVQNIIQRSSLATYQLVFRLLLQIYRAKYLLKLDSFNLRHSEGRSNRICYAIRQRLIWFTNIMHSYVTETVIQASLEKFRSDLASAEDVDAMSELHEKFIAKLQSCCLLMKNLAPIHNSIISILDLAVLYNDAQKSQMQTPKGEESMLSKSQRGYKSRRGRRRSVIPRNNDYSESSTDSSDGENDSNNDADVSAGREEPYEEWLQKIYEQFSQSLHFTVAGLRAIGRAGGEMAWEMLAERLEWGEQRVSLPSTYG